ncbi:hypothetical protein NEOLEDRAFT_686254 [Neolentinus lepideus HHB14362 ss-1]|uniref:Uncharacterized protein n=1 Tax=Neolentinus lepideus HHB14362 ss-1 TaxID=1314782 RepID=A0A165V010_9AGAM|nr:hypothetical protein NEOLEDRAFT_686254 [Neolentinus lepideus HHB14362 ss-1]
MPQLLLDHKETNRPDRGLSATSLRSQNTKFVSIPIRQASSITAQRKHIRITSFHVQWYSSWIQQYPSPGDPPRGGRSQHTSLRDKPGSRKFYHL